MATSKSQMPSSDEQSSEGPGIKPGGIAGLTNLINWPTSAEQSREGHGIKPVGISGLANHSNVLRFLCNDIAAKPMHFVHVYCMLCAMDVSDFMYIYLFDII